MRRRRRKRERRHEMAREAGRESGDGMARRDETKREGEAVARRA